MSPPGCNQHSQTPPRRKFSFLVIHADGATGSGRRARHDPVFHDGPRQLGHAARRCAACLGGRGGGKWGQIFRRGVEFFRRTAAGVEAPPLGLVVSAIGGTPVEAWLSRSALDATRAGSTVWARHHDAIAGYSSALMEKPNALDAVWLAANPTPAWRLAHGIISYRGPAEIYPDGDVRSVRVRRISGPKLQ
jgi:hypothetical protein